MAGVWTGVCVMFPALDAKAAGFNVYAVMDASGDPTEFVSRTTLARFTQAGIVPTSTNVVICELHRTWRRPEAAEIAEIYTVATPNYGQSWRATITQSESGRRTSMRPNTRFSSYGMCRRRKRQPAAILRTENQP